MAAHLCGGAGVEQRRAWLSPEKRAELEAVVEFIAQPGKGISACDESYRTINPHFEKRGVKATEECRRAYRQMLFEAEGASECLTGVILDPETVFQKATDGRSMPKLLADRGLLPGVKPHLQVYALPGTGGETVMQGLDSLAGRLKTYKDAGCLFTKWRSPVIVDVAAGKPSQLAIDSNMRDVARYALISQSEGLVPIIEPDVVMKGNHSLEDAIEINVRVLNALYSACAEHGVHLDGTILKTNMVNPGKDCPTSYTTEQIADANLRTLRRSVPVGARTVNYLSSGQSLAEATQRLDAINKLKIQRGGDRYAPWNISFSWSSAIQMPLFDLCTDPALERDPSNGVPLKAMSKMYGDHIKMASSAAAGMLSSAGPGALVEPGVEPWMQRCVKPLAGRRRVMGTWMQRCGAE